MDIPTSTLHAVLKQLATRDLGDEERGILNACFPEFLQEGDVMETEVEGIGTMRNRIVARD